MSANAWFQHLGAQAYDIDRVAMMRWSALVFVFVTWLGIAEKMSSLVTCSRSQTRGNGDQVIYYEAWKVDSTSPH